MELQCPICQKIHNKPTGEYNRAIDKGSNLYCGRECAGIGRRNGKSLEQRKAEKSEYDKKYRQANSEYLKKRKHEAFIKDYEANPEKYREQRKKRYPKHLEYLRRPQYKEYKHQYDQMYRAKQQYGDYAECFLLTEQILTLIPNRDEIKYEQGSRNKSQIRKRKWKTLMQNL